MARKALTIAAGILFAGGIAVALACDCGDLSRPSEAILKADAVFAGIVESIEEPDLRPQGTNRILFMRKVTFRVSETWRGTNTAKLVAYTYSTWAGCGYDFIRGSNYLVYANLGSGSLAPSTNLFTSICTRTREYDKAWDDLRDLGAGQKPKTK